MQGRLTIEELILDDSFSNYCFRSNEDDVLFWEAYLHANPVEIEKIKEARKIVLGLHTALQQVYDKKGSEQSAADKGGAFQKQPAFGHKMYLRKIVKYAAAVAAVLLLVTGVVNYRGITDRFWGDKKMVAIKKASVRQVFRTANAERRSFTLSDSTVVRLNAGSTLQVAEDFGTNNRIVYLSGEALFDVRHNKELPFIVRINSYDVKVLGTLFNVRAYPGEKVSETALFKGKVQIIKEDGGDLTLVPNQKVIFKRIEDVSAAGNANARDFKTLTTQNIVPLSISPKYGTAPEAAWAQNRLEIVKESFEDMKPKLERWYNVKIFFTTEEVSRYTFTATFEKESIREVLAAFQYTYPFTFTIEKEKITISK